MAKILVSLIVLGWLFSNTGLQKTFQELSTSNLWYIPICVVIYLVGQILSAYRWQVLARALGFQLSLREFYDYYLIGMYFNLFMPSAIGGDVGRMYYLAKGAERKKREALLTIVAERASGLVSLMLITCGVCLTPIADVLPASLRLTLLGMLAVGVIGFISLQVIPIQKLAERFPKLSLLAQAQIYWKNWPLLIHTVLISTIFHGLMIVVHIMITRALNVDVAVAYLAMVYGVVSLISVIPISFNGIGLREGAYQFLLVKYGLVAHIALAFGLYWFVISTLTSLCGSIVLIKGHYKTPAVQELEAEAG